MAAPRPSPARGQDAGRKSPSASPWFPTPACRQRGLHPPGRATREGIEGLRVLLVDDTDDVREGVHLIGRVRCCWPRVVPWVQVAAAGFDRRCRGGPITRNYYQRGKLLTLVGTAGFEPATP